MVPRAIANERDWRLFQELSAQADIFLTSGRYLREWAKGQAQEILPDLRPVSQTFASGGWSAGCQLSGYCRHQRQPGLRGP